MTPIILFLVALAPAQSMDAQPQTQSAGQVAVQPDDDPEIVVLARKAQAVRITFKIDDKTRRSRCKIKKSSGDKEFDAAMCEPVRRCANVQPLTRDTVAQCLQRTRREVLEEFRASRRAK